MGPCAFFDLEALLSAARGCNGVTAFICLLGKVGTQSGGNDAVEYPVGQDARQEGE